MKTVKKIFALILLFALLLSASAFLTSFRTKNSTPYLTPPAGAPSPHLHIDFQTRSGSAVLLVDYGGATSSLPITVAGVGKIQINITAEVDGQSYLLRSVGNYHTQISGDEELVIPAEYFTKDQGDLFVHSEILVFLDRGSDAHEVYTSTWHQLYKKVPGTISLSSPETKNEENEKNDDQAPPSSSFGCAARPASSESSEQKKGNTGGGSSTGNGTQSGM